MHTLPDFFFELADDRGCEPKCNIYSQYSYIFISIDRRSIYLFMNVSIMEVPDIVERAAEELVLRLADSNAITIPRGWYVD